MKTDTDRTVPIVVGVTAHRAIREQDRAALHDAVCAELRKLQESCPSSRLVMLCSLAEGGDLLCADAAEQLGIPVIAVLPRPREDYERDFSEEAGANFARHCARAEQVFVAPPTEALPETGAGRDWLFRQAGIYVAVHCHVLLALWDGGPGTAAACGTAEAVDFALNGSYTPRTGMPLRSGSNTAVIHVVTPRDGHQGEEAPAGTVHILGDREAVRDLLRKTDDYNRCTIKYSPTGASRLPEGAGGDPVLNRLESVGRAAGKLSERYALRFRRVLGLLALAAALLTFAFLMYDEAQAIWMILVCGAMLILAWACRRYAVYSDCHRRYLEFRVLAECLRVQTYLRYAGSRVRAAEQLSWTQREETSWVLAALCALEIGEEPATEHEIRACWVDDQRDYHRRAALGADRRLRTSERTVDTALFVSIALYLAAVGFELLCGGLVFRPTLGVSDVEFWRTLLKILLGTISAVTLFIANFYGRMSLTRSLSDHQKMERFYQTMSDRLGQAGQTEELLTVLAREELIENGNWCSYQRDNKPDVSL